MCVGGIKNPESGPVMEGTGGIRKVRFPLTNRGKSHSVRVCYTDFEEYEVIYLITAFTKNEQDNLSDNEKKVLKKSSSKEKSSSSALYSLAYSLKQLILSSSASSFHLSKNTS